MKGLLAILILVHHLYQYTGLFQGTIFAIPLQALGYLSVAEFFFLSGYGLAISYDKKTDQYIQQFPKKRILPFYLVIIVLTCVWICLKGIFHEDVVLSEIGMSFLFGGTVIKGGWYLQVQLLLYVLWFLIYRSQKSSHWKLKCLFVVELLYCGFMGKLGYPTTWYEGVIAFPIGILWSNRRNEINAYFQSTQRWLRWVMGSFLLFIITFILPHMALPECVCVVVKIISAAVFVVFGTLIIYRIPVRGRVTRFLGSISLEIYTMQFVFLVLFHSELINISNPYIYITAVVVATTCAAMFFKIMVDKIYGVCRKI